LLGLLLLLIEAGSTEESSIKANPLPPETEEETAEAEVAEEEGMMELGLVVSISIKHSNSCTSFWIAPMLLCAGIRERREGGGRPE
jgi:hypothetical protein